MRAAITLRRLAMATVTALVVAVATPALGDEAGDETPRPPRQHEVLRERPSGFWTSNRPAKEPYRWRLLAIGAGIAAISGVVMWRLVRRASRDRLAR